MLYRYRLMAALNGNVVYEGSFSSINHLVKVACSFSEDCTLQSFDDLFDKVIPIYSLVSEFKCDANGI